MSSQFFNLYNRSSEADMVESLAIEAIKIYGTDMIYLVRGDMNVDPIFNEDDTPIFDKGYHIEMYPKTVDAMGGEGDLLSKFGFEVRDSITAVVAVKTFERRVGRMTGRPRPWEGDIIYFPLMKQMFQITLVSDKTVLFQNGRIFVWEITADLIENSGEKYDTGYDEVDNFVDHIGPIDSLEELKDKDPIAQNFDFYNQEQLIRDFSESDPFAEQSDVRKNRDD